MKQFKKRKKYRDGHYPLVYVEILLVVNLGGVVEAIVMPLIYCFHANVFIYLKLEYTHFLVFLLNVQRCDQSGILCFLFHANVFIYLKLEYMHFLVFLLNVQRCDQSGDLLCFLYIRIQREAGSIGFPIVTNELVLIIHSALVFYSNSVIMLLLMNFFLLDMVCFGLPITGNDTTFLEEWMETAVNADKRTFFYMIMAWSREERMQHDQCLLKMRKKQHRIESSITHHVVVVYLINCFGGLKDTCDLIIAILFELCKFQLVRIILIRTCTGIEWRASEIMAQFLEYFQKDYGDRFFDTNEVSLLVLGWQQVQRETTLGNLCEMKNKCPSKLNKNDTGVLCHRQTQSNRETHQCCIQSLLLDSIVWTWMLVLKISQHFLVIGTLKVDATTTKWRHLLTLH